MRLTSALLLGATLVMCLVAAAASAAAQCVIELAPPGLNFPA